MKTKSNPVFHLRLAVAAVISSLARQVAIAGAEQHVLRLWSLERGGRGQLWDTEVI